MHQVVAIPQTSARRVGPKAVCCWAAGKRQPIEGVICSKRTISD